MTRPIIQRGNKCEQRVIRQSGATPALDQLADPQPGQGLSVGTLVAAALNLLDVAITNDQFPFRRLQPPASPAGKRSCSSTTHPPLPGRPARPVRHAGRPGAGPGRGRLSGPARPRCRPRSALDGRLGGARLPRPPPARRDSADPRGRRHSGPARGASRPAPRRRPGCRGRPREGPQASRRRGADAVVDVTDDQAIDARLAGAAPSGYDVIIDFLWGGWPPLAMNHASIVSTWPSRPERITVIWC